MWAFYNGLDEEVSRLRKCSGCPTSQVLMHHPFKENEKYMREVTGQDAENEPILGDPVNNESFDEETQLAAAKDAVRVTRDAKLVEGDHIFIRHNEELKLIEESVDMTTAVDNTKYVAFLKYKRELRDLPDTLSNFEDIKKLVWPTKPSK